MRRLLAVLAALFIASPALPATYHVRPNGSAYATGASYAAAWSMAKANTAALPGDVVHVYPGTYSTPINPDSGGSNPTGRITFVGATTGSTADPLTSAAARATIIVPGLSLTRPNVSIKGLTIGGSITKGEAARFDSVLFCTVAGGLYLEGSYFTLSECTVNGTMLAMGRTAQRTTGIRLENSTFPNIGKGVTSSVSNPVLSLWAVGNSDCGTPGISRMVDSCQFVRLTRTFTIDPDLGDSHPCVFYKVRHFLQSYCNTTIHYTAPHDPRARYAYRLRDSTGVFTFNCDTLITDGDVGSGTYNAVEMFMDSNGNTGCLGRYASVSDVVVDSCLWNFAGTAGPSSVQWQEAMNNFTMTYTTVVTNGPAILTHSARGTNTFDHNTFVGRGGYGAVKFFDADAPSFGDTALIFTNNIVYLAEPAYVGPVPQYNGSVTNPAQTFLAAWFDSCLVDSAGATHQVRLVSDNNLYSYYGYATTPGDKSITARAPNCSSYYLHSRPGDGFPWEIGFDCDSLSVYGSPLFGYGGADSAFTSSFDPHLGIGSAAIGNGSGSSDIGAVDYVESARAELYPTAAIFNRGTPDSVIFTLTNHGDYQLTSVYSLSNRPLWANAGVAVDLSETVADVIQPTDHILFIVHYDGTDTYVNTSFELVVSDPTRPKRPDGQHHVSVPIVVF